MQHKLELFTTADGSQSIRVPELNECYHSKFGAITESQHIFINAGLLPIAEKQSAINILEIGFGTGLNAFMTYIAAAEKSLHIYYTGIELFPLDIDIAINLNYPEALHRQALAPVFKQLHEAHWDTKTTISDFFNFEKLHKSLISFLPEKQLYHLIYFDAFGPDIQPDLWSVNIFEKLAGSLKPEGCLVTYSTKGDVKRALKTNNFKIEKLPGPPGKREIIRATLFK